MTDDELRELFNLVATHRYSKAVQALVDRDQHLAAVWLTACDRGFDHRLFDQLESQILAGELNVEMVGAVVTDSLTCELIVRRLPPDSQIWRGVPNRSHTARPGCPPDHHVSVAWAGAPGPDTGPPAGASQLEAMVWLLSGPVGRSRSRTRHVLSVDHGLDYPYVLIAVLTAASGYGWHVPDETIAECAEALERAPRAPPLRGVRLVLPPVLI